MSDELRALRLAKSIPVREMVEVVRPLYPKYDKTVQSKCENGDAYGVDLRKDAMEALYKAFDPEALTKARKKKDCHRLICRISCRLETDEYVKLKQLVEAEGYGTMQDWLAARIREYIKDGDPDALCDF